MLVVRDVLPYKAFAMALSFPTAGSPAECLFNLVDNSRCSHNHGTNRNRIALHVMLNRRRNPARVFR